MSKIKHPLCAIISSYTAHGYYPNRPSEPDTFEFKDRYSATIVNSALVGRYYNPNLYDNGTHALLRDIKQIRYQWSNIALYMVDGLACDGAEADTLNAITDQYIHNFMVNSFQVTYSMWNVSVAGLHCIRDYATSRVPQYKELTRHAGPFVILGDGCFETLLDLDEKGDLNSPCLYSDSVFISSNGDILGFSHNNSGSGSNGHGLTSAA